MKFAAVLTLVLAAATSAAFADSPLVATLDARKVVVVDGRETFASADVAKPRDVIEYRTTYRNVSKGSLHAVAATLPVPAGFEYLEGTASKGVTASLDGKTYAPLPLTRTVKTADGRTKVETVPASEFRSLRWELGDMPAAASQTVVARMRMSDATSQAAAR